jgi:hypothetical protein
LRSCEEAGSFSSIAQTMVSHVPMWRVNHQSGRKGPQGAYSRRLWRYGAHVACWSARKNWISSDERQHRSKSRLRSRSQVRSIGVVTDECPWIGGSLEMQTRGHLLFVCSITLRNLPTLGTYLPALGTYLPTSAYLLHWKPEGEGAGAWATQPPKHQRKTYRRLVTSQISEVLTEYLI